MTAFQLLLALATLYVAGSAMPVSDPQLLLGRQPFFQRPHRPRPGGFLPGLFGNPQQQPAVPATPAALVEAPKSPEGVVPQSPDAATPAVTGEAAVPKNPGSLFTPGAPMGSNTDISGLLGMINGGQLGSATAGGAGNGAVQDGAAIGQGTGIANVGPGGFGIGLGIGGAIATPLGNLAFGQGDSIAVGK
ncbi:hypothetical protein GHT06_022408 [Daphnia sinensis]|uniref:Uncharacterized protein n=1 Tax=Daphnia sinensis TaxID=1820382 RepID=A0AAD5KXT1_9CRUS|nr:hypothetical protein GHT06_022408 [Daphnia sinensis]